MDIILNKRQEEAVKIIQKYIDTPINKREYPFITISGAGGSGKTTVIRYALEKYASGGAIYGAAISNSATHELSKSLTFATSVTITKLLNKKRLLNKTTGNYTFEITNKSEMNMPLKKAKIIVIDECSMIHQEELDNILKYKSKSAVLIFLGDICQLKPIGSEAIYSPTFSGGILYELTENMRAKEPLDELNNELRDEILFFYEHNVFGKPYLVDDKIHFNDVKINIEDKEYGYYNLTTEEQMIDKFIELYYLESNNPLNVKIVVYKNDTIKRLNDTIREKLYGDTDSYFIEGDNILSNSHYSNGEEFSISNNQYLIVLNSMEKTDNNDIEVIIMDLKNEAGNVIEGVKCVNPKKGFKQYMIRKNQKYKLAQRGNITYQEYNQFLDEYANFSYGYAITAYKVQGQTLTNVIVYESEIKQVKPISELDALRSIYVGDSRAKEKVFML